MENTTRHWRNLGVVETIYEEEDENSTDGNSTPSLSPVLSPSPAPLRSRLLPPWPLASGKETDVVIHVQGSSFHLHKGPLRAKSGYLKRQLKLKDSTKELTISPPLNITPETFSLLIDYFHGAHIAVTPLNVAALRVAAESLEMTEVNGATSGEDLRHKTESYFRRLISGDNEYASDVLKSCISLMPEAETTASLVSRCIEALSMKDENEGVLSSMDDVRKLSVENFQVVVESMNRRLTCHDILYRTVDLFLKGHIGDITEEEKIRMCNYIDCTLLSPQLLMHAVQNPRMPLRFVIQAMFLEQLNTRRTIISAADHHHNRHNHNTNHELVKLDHDQNAQTLGAILQRDAALRQVAQLKETMDSTRSKIQSLEKELLGMRRILQESESTRKENNLDSGRSQSFRIVSSNQENKIGRDQMGSVSSASFRFLANKERGGVSMGWSSSSEGSPFNQAVLPRRTKEDQKNLGRRLINGLKSAFGVSSTMLKKPKPEIKDSSGKIQGDGDERGENGEIGDVDVVVIKKNLPFQRRAAHPL